MCFGYWITLERVIELCKLIVPYPDNPMLKLVPVLGEEGRVGLAVAKAPGSLSHYEWGTNPLVFHTHKVVER